jgi:hypothetical protein
MSRFPLQRLRKASFYNQTDEEKITKEQLAALGVNLD